MDLIRYTAKCFSLLAGLLLSCSVLAADIAGHVIMVKGTAQATGEQGEVRTLHRRDPVYVSDTVTTADDSRVQIRFIDDGLLALQSNSSMALHAYQKGESGKDAKVLMELVEGGFRTLTGTIGKADKAAYRVETPVASIGIRGTLYSALLRDGKLVAGVWKGGITLFTPQGNFDLGAGADYAFGTYDSDGFHGSLQATDDLDQGPQAGSAQNNSNTTPAGGDGVTEITAIPNPLDQDNDGNTLEELISKGIVKDENQSPDVRLTTEEYAALLASTQVARLVINGEITDAAVFIDDNGQPVFVSIDDSEGTDITRFTYANAADTGAPESVTGVAWGIWKGTQSTPITQYLSDNSLVATDVTSPAVWVVADPVLDSVLSTLSGTVTFYGYEGLGFDSNNQSLLSVNGGFDLDFSSGDISNGYISASFGSAATATTDTTVTGDWYANFNGTISADGVNSANATMTFLEGTYSDYTNESGYANMDLANSTMEGVLTGPAADAFVGAFHFQTETDQTNTTIITADGVVAWPQSLGDSVTGQ